MSHKLCFCAHKLCFCAHKLCFCAHKLCLCNINIVYVIFVQTAFHRRRNKVNGFVFATCSIICEKKSSNRNQEQSGRYTELQDALNKRRDPGILEVSYSIM